MDSIDLKTESTIRDLLQMIQGLVATKEVGYSENIRQLCQAVEHLKKSLDNRV